MTPSRLPPYLEAFRYRNYRLFWSAHFVSFVGTMMQSAAVLWQISLMVKPENKGFALGLVGLVRVVPIVAFSMLGGVLADARDRRVLMLVTQVSMAVFAAVLAWLSFRGIREVWPIYALSFLGAAAGAFDSPARQAIVHTLVPRDVLPNAIGLNTTMFQVASVVGPALAGIVIATLGVSWAYLLNAISFVSVLAALLVMRGVPRPSREERGDVSMGAAMEGLRFVFSRPLLRSTMVLDFFATFFSSATALLPIFAQDILHVGAQGYGWLYAAPAVGAMVMGALMVRFVHRIHRRGVVLLWAVAGYGLATVVFGFSRSFWITFVCLALTGVTDTVSMVLRNILRHTITPDHLRGRMSSIMMVFFMGGPQLGELEAGMLAGWMGATFSVVSGGVGCILATAVTAWRTPDLRGYQAPPAAETSEAPRRRGASPGS